MTPNFEDHFHKNRDLYQKAIHEGVCEHCIDRDEKGFCRSMDPEGCAVLRNLEALVTLALELRDRKIEPYAKLVRERLCVPCKNSKDKGQSCRLRESVDCGLDRYLPLVLTAIEKIKG